MSTSLKCIIGKTQSLYYLVLIYLKIKFLSYIAKANTYYTCIYITVDFLTQSVI